MILKNIKLKNNLKKIVDKKQEIDDILVFGSTVRGKEDPGDIDIIIIFKKTVDKNVEYGIRKELDKYYSNISIISKTKKTVLEPAFDARESLLFESISLLSGKNLAREYGFSQLGMFKYEIKGRSNLEKTKFYHALNGRSGQEGILKKLNCIKLSDNIIITELGKIEHIKEFLDFWKINYIYIPILIPQRMNRKNILQN